MCRSTLEYASQIWDPYLGSEIDRLEKIQRRAARFVVRDFQRTSSVTAIMDRLNWTPLKTRRKHARLGLLYQIVNGEVEVPVDGTYLKQGRRGRFIQPAFHYQGHKYSYYPNTIRDWNELSGVIKDSPSLAVFKKRLLKQMD